jgi:hypothetical protein
MPRVLVNIQSGDYWSVHFIGPDNNTRIGPWLLLDSHDEARAILRWGNISADEITEHESSIRRWSTSSVGLEITERQLAQLVERGKSWPWNGYELLQMKKAGKYPQRIDLSHAI